MTGGLAPRFTSYWLGHFGLDVMPLTIAFLVLKVHQRITLICSYLLSGLSASVFTSADSPTDALSSIMNNKKFTSLEFWLHRSAFGVSPSGEIHLTLFSHWTCSSL